MAAMTIREARPDDAGELVAYMLRLTGEIDSNLVTGPGEWRQTEQEERTFIAAMAAAPNSLFLVAEVAGRIAGILTCEGGNRSAIRHTTVLGISVDQAYRGCGAGTTLLEQAIVWAKASDVVTRIELQVFARNTGAVRLYERYGFRVEGRRRRAYFRNGEYLDGLIMALLLE